MMSKFSPCLHGVGDRQKQEQDETENAEGETNLRRVHECAGAGAHGQGPTEITATSAEAERPGRPEAASGGMREQTAAYHFRIDRSGRPGNRPAKNEAVNEDGIHAMLVTALSSRAQRRISQAT